MTRRHAAVLAALLSLAACQNSADLTTTTSTTEVANTAGPTETSVTTVPTTTTSTSEAPTSTSTEAEDFTWLNVEGIDFPADPADVDELPSVLTDYIDAPMPEPDLSISGPDDAERWVAEWLDWMAWAGANPEPAADVVNVGWLLTAPQGEQTQQGLEEDVAEGTRSLGIPFYPVSITGTFDEQFENGQILNLFIEVEDRVPTYTIGSSGAVIDVRERSPQTPVLRLVLRLDEEDQWRVEQIAVDN